MEIDNTFAYKFTHCVNEHSRGKCFKRQRTENGILGDKSDETDDYKAPSMLKDMNCHHSGGGEIPANHRHQQGTCFVQLHAHQEIFQSEKWKPNGSTLYHPLPSHLLVNFEKYDQISFDEGLFFIGDETGGCLQKEQGHVIHCWRFDDKEKTLFIAMSYLFTNFCVFQEIVNRLNYA
ncbi:uncharacterized protein LOC143974462 isoform X1 [Lithobates pipiens]